MHQGLFDPDRCSRCSLTSAAPAAAPRRRPRRQHNRPSDRRYRSHPRALGIDRWLVVGGSWGATLALAYAEAHPQRVSGLVLRAVFLGTRAELDWAFGTGLLRIRPQLHRSSCRAARARGAAPPPNYWRRILVADPWRSCGGERLARCRARAVGAYGRRDAGLDGPAGRPGPCTAGDGADGGALFQPGLLSRARPADARRRPARRPTRHRGAGALRHALPATQFGRAVQRVARRPAARGGSGGAFPRRARRLRLGVGRHSRAVGAATMAPALPPGSSDRGRGTRMLCHRRKTPPL